MPGKITQAFFVFLFLVQQAIAQGVDTTALKTSQQINVNANQQGSNVQAGVRDSSSIEAQAAGKQLDMNVQDSLNTGPQNASNFNLRYILNKISINFNIGYGRTFYSTRLDNFGVVSNPYNGSPGVYLFDTTNTNQIYANWLSKPVPIDTVSLTASDNIYRKNDNNKSLKYAGNSPSIPISLTLFYSFLDRFRVGLGATAEFHTLPVMHPIGDVVDFADYVPDKKRTIFLRYYGMVGMKIYALYGWTYYADLRIGNLNMGNAFNNKKGLYFNIGFPMEFEFSEYLSAVVRPSFEYKSYNLDVGSLGVVNHQFPAAYLTFGFKYNIPEAPRCRLHASIPPGKDYPRNFTNKSCRIQTKHYHNGKLYRGQPFYKPQNPDIGQNYKNLVEYKFFNRRKISGGF